MSASTYCVVQLNMNGNHLVSEQILDYSRANGVEVLLLQEVPTSGNRLVGFDYGAVKTVLSCRDGSAGAAIVVLNQDIEVVDLQGLSDRYCAVASLRKGRGQAVVFVSAYFKYSIQTRIFTDRLGDILDRVNNDVVIGADVNAHSPQWFSRPGNNSGSARGTHVESLIAAKHLTVHNQPGRLDTYERPGMGSSNIDVTLTRGGSLTHSVSEWEVLDVTDSDHRTIRFKIQVGSGLDGPSVGKSRFNVRKADWDRFRWVLAQKVYGDPETMAGGCGQAAESLTRALGLAMEASMPRSRKSVRIKPPWWDAGLKESKRRLNNFRRTKDYKVSDRDQFRVLRNEHLKKIRKAKMESWRKFATSINSDIWGPVYRWARNGSAKSRVPNAVLRENGTFTVTALETAECLLESLIPRDRTAPVFADECVGRVRPEVTEAEVKRAVWRMAPNKASGLDGITAGVLRKAWGVIGTPLTSVLAECLRKSEFPDCWKTAEVVVIKKGEDRDPGLPKSYRPVSLLSALSKVLERLVVDRLEEETGGALSAEQHGFRVGKSTISAIKSCLDWVDNSEEDMVVGIFLDISGAFDNLRWNILIRDMVDLGASDATRSIIQSYLTGWRAVLSVEGATAFADLTRGCPQGSQLGPSLWNLSMDRALVTSNDDWVKLVAYADDLAVLIAGSDLGDIQEKARATLGALRDWATLRGLTFSASKSQAIPLKGGLRPGFTIPFGVDEIVAVGSVRSEDGSVMEHDSCAGPSKGPTQILRSPISQGSSPVSKKAKVSPNPAPVARDAIRWIRHTLEEQSTKRSAMPVETQRNMFDMLTRLDAAVHDLVMTNLEGQSQLEEARRSSEMCVAAAVAQFGAEMRLREAAHEQTLEAVVARLTEKEATRTAVPEAVIRVPEAMQGTEKGNTYSSVARRKTERSRDRNADRSRSRAAMRNKKLKEVRQEDHVPSYILNECPGKTLKDIKELIWSQVKAKKKNPKCHTVTTKTGKTILRPSDKETSDVLKHLSAVSSLIKVDSLRWPRVVVRGVSSDMDMTIETQRDILGQNPELEISSDTEDEVIRPIFKSGPRMRSTTTWVMEVNPKYYLKFEDTTLYIGFMRCRVSVYEEVTQCHICLRYGHPGPNATKRNMYVHTAVAKGTKPRIARPPRQNQNVQTAGENTVRGTRHVRPEPLT
ncbi:hypothetical protein QTP88_021197 [Uroleucon formosanum]